MYKIYNEGEYAAEFETLEEVRQWFRDVREDDKNDAEFYGDEWSPEGWREYAEDVYEVSVPVDAKEFLP